MAGDGAQTWICADKAQVIQPEEDRARPGERLDVAVELRRQQRLQAIEQWPLPPAHFRIGRASRMRIHLRKILGVIVDKLISRRTQRPQSFILCLCVLGVLCGESDFLH